MTVQTKKDGTTLTILPEGRLDTLSAPDLQKVVNENIAGITDLTFDLVNLTYLSSAGLRVIMSAQKTMVKQGKMRLLHVNQDVMDVMDMVGLTNVFTIE